MKTKKMISALFASLLIVAMCVATNTAVAQTKTMKDCCMMKDGKMMCMKDGKTMPMSKDMVMSNGTKCMMNGDCVMKDGKKMKMKEGECMDMDGKMDMCSMMNKETKATTTTTTTTKKHSIAKPYSCPMHPEVTSSKPGKCPKCGMALVKKK